MSAANVQLAFEMAVERNQSNAVQPVVFLSSSLPWNSQRSPQGLQVLREGILDAIEYGAQVINVAGLGCSNLAKLPYQHQRDSLDSEVFFFNFARLPTVHSPPPRSHDPMVSRAHGPAGPWSRGPAV